MELKERQGLEIKDLTEGQLQVALTASFGDGYMHTGNLSSRYNTNNKNKEYLEFKAQLLGEDLCPTIRYVDKNGYSQTYIWTLSTYGCKGFMDLQKLSIIEKLELMTDLGFAMWVYDDGSLHKHNMFYNINTHAYSREDNLIISEFINKKYNICSRVISESKKDGRVFWYIYVPTTGGALTVTKILKKYPVECYRYKMWNEEYQKNMEEVTTLAEERLACKDIKLIHPEVMAIRRGLASYRNKVSEATLTDWVEFKKTQKPVKPRKKKSKKSLA